MFGVSQARSGEQREKGEMAGEVAGQSAEEQQKFIHAEVIEPLSHLRISGNLFDALPSSAPLSSTTRDPSALRVYADDLAESPPSMNTTPPTPTASFRAPLASTPQGTPAPHEYGGLISSIQRRTIDRASLDEGSPLWRVKQASSQDAASFVEDLEADLRLSATIGAALLEEKNGLQRSLSEVEGANHKLLDRLATSVKESAQLQRVRLLFSASCKATELCQVLTHNRITEARTSRGEPRARRIDQPGPPRLPRERSQDHLSPFRRRGPTRLHLFSVQDPHSHTRGYASGARFGAEARGSCGESREEAGGARSGDGGQAQARDRGPRRDAAGQDLAQAEGQRRAREVQDEVQAVVRRRVGHWSERRGDRGGRDVQDGRAASGGERWVEDGEHGTARAAGAVEGGGAGLALRDGSPQGVRGRRRRTQHSARKRSTPQHAPLRSPHVSLWIANALRFRRRPTPLPHFDQPHFLRTLLQLLQQSRRQPRADFQYWIDVERGALEPVW